MWNMLFITLCNLCSCLPFSWEDTAREWWEWKERTRSRPIFMYTDPLISTSLAYTHEHRVIEREIREKRCLISVRLINDTLLWNIFSVCFFFPLLFRCSPKRKCNLNLYAAAQHWYTRLRSLREHIASNFREDDWRKETQKTHNSEGTKYFVIVFFLFLFVKNNYLSCHLLCFFPGWISTEDIYSWKQTADRKMRLP